MSKRKANRPPLVPIERLDAKPAEPGAPVNPEFTGLTQTSVLRPWELPLVIQAVMQQGQVIIGVLPHQFPNQPLSGYLITSHKPALPFKSTSKT